MEKCGGGGEGGKMEKWTSGRRRNGLHRGGWRNAQFYGQAHTETHKDRDSYRGGATLKIKANI